MSEKTNATDIPALATQMHAAFAQQQWEKCEQLCLQIEALEPANAETANVRGIVASQMGDARSAEQYFVRAVNGSPERIDFQLNLGRLYLQQGLAEDALHRFQAALQLKSSDLTAALGMGQCLLQLGDRQQAYDVFMQAKEKHPNNHVVYMALFRSSFQLNKVDEAKRYLDDVLKSEPKHAEAHLGLGQIALQQGDFEEAEKQTLQAIAINPDLSLSYPILSGIKTFTANDKELIDRIVAQRQKVLPESAANVDLSFVLGKIMDDLGDYESAFEYIKQANEVRHTHNQYHADAELAHLQAMIDHTTPETLAVTSSNNSETPFFIVGMPRCGSTLVEQIISAHPDVTSMGECGYFESSLAQFNDPADPITLEKMASFPAEKWQQIGETYLDLARQQHTDNQHFTDKTLTNIRLLGAIHRTFPKAKIIHVRRDPIDTCWSIYKNNFVGQAFNYAFNLGELGYYYRTYERLMDHWRTILPQGVLYELHYEALVQHSEIEILKLLDAIHLESTEACFSFYKSHDFNITASQAQVRKPIQATSIHAWKKYEKPLQPLIQILRR